MLAIAGKGGIVYGIDRSSRIPVFNTPGTTLENNEIPVSGTWLYVCPGLQGGVMFTSPAYNTTTGTLYAGMNDHCAWYIKDNGIPGLKGFVVKDWPAAAKLEAPRGWVTAINGKPGRCGGNIKPSRRCRPVWCRPGAVCCSPATRTAIF